MSFERAVAFTIEQEGSVLVEDPADPGGLTKFGISQKSYPRLNIATLTRAEAERIYYTDFWMRVQGETWAYPIGLTLFDTGVNAGVVTAIRTLQQCVGAVTDGVIGPQTRRATTAWDPQVLMLEMLSRRLLRLTTLPTWPRYGLGWGRRCFACCREALTP